MSKTTRVPLCSTGFGAFLSATFLGAFNDNLFKMILSLLAVKYLPLIGAIFILPFILFSGYAGQVSDRFSKRNVLIFTKVLEAAIMLLALFAFLVGRIEPLVFILFLMAIQSTFFSPAKYAIIPEMVDEKDLSKANGWLEMITFFAIILGTSLGGYLFDLWELELHNVAVVLVVVAILGAIVSLLIPRVPASGEKSPFTINPWHEIGYGIGRIRENRALRLTIIGIAYFWFMAALFQMLLIILGENILQVSATQVGLLGAFLSIGIGLGSATAGMVSGKRIVLELIPFGSIGMGISMILIYFFSTSYAWTSFGLVLVGFASGFYIVPLNAFLQRESGAEEKGRMIATNNFINTCGIMLSSGILWFLNNLIGFTSAQIIFMIGIITMGVTVYVGRLLPDLWVRIFTGTLIRLLFNAKVKGLENIPKTGPVLLVSNHISYADGHVLCGLIRRPIRFLVYSGFFKDPLLRSVLNLINAIPISSDSTREAIKGIRDARKVLKNGEAVCIFPEGGLTRSGAMLPFKSGFERIVKGTDAPIVPIFIDGLWGTIFSYGDGSNWKRLLHTFRRKITITIGEPLPTDTTAPKARQRIVEMDCQHAKTNKHPDDNLAFNLIRNAKKHWFSFLMADSTGKELTNGKTLIASLLLSKWIRTNCNDQKMIGVLLPASVGGVITNFAISLSAKTSVNLNFTAGIESVQSAIDRCEIKTILTSQKFIKRIPEMPESNYVYLEELLPHFSTFDKILTAAISFLLPARWVKSLYCPEPISPDSPATILFSSGSTGEPKGAVISHFNIVASSRSWKQAIAVTQNDCVMGSLPFFHSFGLSATAWLPILLECRGVYHPNPLEAKEIGELCKKYKTTLVVASPTFCKNYIRRCSEDTFESVRWIITGAEKLPRTVANDFNKKFNYELLEGYGVTEMSPVVSANLPNSTTKDLTQIRHKIGSVGQPVPGVAPLIIDPETREPLPIGEEGLLLTDGPNRMVEYYKDPERTQKAFHGEWYITGDIAKVDEDGFIYITDRLERFSKIGGEMVPHVKIEQEIMNILSDTNCVVTSAPDEKKGERIVVFLANPTQSIDEIWSQLREKQLPSLWIPKRDDFFLIDEIPTLGTGKLNLKKVKDLAKQYTQTNATVT
jgi:acyl-[acyl-carrier-protein]-phospholipid O-acyltransferase/long-chain-fatty-acid--[acyl-carrier-protein] ligase